jgi:hypothetical protein
MTPAQHQESVDIAKVVANEYFDHYLTLVFPGQIEQLFKAHNRDVNAHILLIAPIQKTLSRGKKFVWMVLGGSAVIGTLLGIAVDHAGAILKALAG